MYGTDIILESIGGEAFEVPLVVLLVINVRSEPE
jgi:hypothetical protein